MAQILCFNCTTNTVDAPTFDFASTQVEVQACGECRSRYGMVSAMIRKSMLVELAVPRYTVRHSQLLVSFA